MLFKCIVAVSFNEFNDTQHPFNSEFQIMPLNNAIEHQYVGHLLPFTAIITTTELGLV